MTFFELQTKFPTELSIIEHFIKLKYPTQPACTHCGSIKVYHSNTRPKNFHCNDCESNFSIFKGTIFEDSDTDLRKWMYAIHLFLNGKKGISGLQLKREIGVTYKTAWRMLKQIRKAMAEGDNLIEFSEIVEVDETYVGGKPRKSNDQSQNNQNKRGRGTGKMPVVGVIDRINKRVFARVMWPDKRGKKLTGAQLKEVIDQIVMKQSLVITDEFSGYNFLAWSEHSHLIVNHSENYAKGFAHTNNIESFWSTLKRGIYGIYHHVSPKYLQLYVSEFCFRYNNRNNNNMFEKLLGQCILS